MRSYIGHHEVVTALELEELAFGFEERTAGLDRDLFRGPLSPETMLERAAREDAARDVIAELTAEGESGDEVAAWDALYADALTRTVPFLRSAQAGCSSGTGEAA
ncbi:hypothetical protein [Streptomyces albireticuli]|uniref:Uncharacterized protein n=1 Tax=Streptomyces albireticuli TaxID=1940 RepID=A0A2A2D845_9ACTN|nr:hypothetical protein [Streptomyces albireticuli]MCD9144365.1 hypothetical protein [Streptomyces albireticuli]MCD9161992.1 hypothetical protein [Streptomyces albireticuli]MCD9194002.1 hypothetical protein [Streptomyces albireticuli]PAU47510.1 hypothetical protein CK936_18110 [Streptomyces albireticuli]